jgi:NAD(P)-dependent dehydrogenase (short-subunit alcohol dehydrogenase family)
MSREKLAGQVAIVTGAGRGIGRAIALELAAAGAAVGVAARSADEIEETVESIAAAGGRSHGRICDVSDQASVTELVESVEGELGPVTLLVNNAATLAALGPTWEVDLAAWRLDIEVTLFGTLYCTRAVLPGMIARGGGRIINVSSMNAVWGLLYSSSYDCAKTAQLRLTECLAGELSSHGIKAFALAPGPVRTRMSEASAAPEVAHWMQNRGFLFDIASDPIPAEHAARSVAYLATGRADRLSGRFLTVQDDLDELVAAADEIERDDLLTLRVASLRGLIRNGQRPASREPEPLATPAGPAS